MARPKKALRDIHGKRAIIYIRVSTEEQLKGGHHGVEAQLAACIEYLARKGYIEVCIQRDLGKSGAKGIASRPGIATALELCEGGLADVIVCYAQDRLARKSGVFEDIRERAVRGHFRLETARDGQDLTTEENELSADAMSFVASIERKMIAKRLYGGRKERGKIDGRGSSTLPYGYRYHLEVVATSDGDQVVKTIEVDPEAAEVVRIILELRQAHSYQYVADSLNALGHRTPRSGREWTVGNVQGIERNAELYRTGIRRWDGIEGAERWPIIVENEGTWDTH